MGGTRGGGEGGGSYPKAHRPKRMWELPLSHAAILDCSDGRHACGVNIKDVDLFPCMRWTVITIIMSNKEYIILHL